MRHRLPASSSFLPVLINALTIPVSNSISAAPITDSPSQSLNCSALGPLAQINVSAVDSNAAFQDTGQDDPGGEFNLTESLLPLNDNLVRSDLDETWHGDFIYLGRDLCAAAVLVDAAHALAKMALNDLLVEETFTVSNYNEVQIKVTPFEAGFTRRYAAIGTFVAIQRMDKDDRFQVSRFTFFKGKQRMGKIDFIGQSCSSDSCGANLGNASLPLVVPSNKSSLVANLVGPSQSAATTLVHTINDNVPDMELDCEWHGRKIHPRVAMLAPSSVLTYSHIVKEDPMGLPALRDVVDDQTLGMSMVLMATPHPNPSAPLWSYFWAIQALGKMPEKMADKFDWREMTMTVKVDGFQLGTISLPTVSGPSPSLPGSNNDSTFVI